MSFWTPTMSFWTPTMSFWTKWRISRSLRRWVVVQTSRCFALLSMTLYNMTPCVVILSVTKNLLADYALSTLSLVGFEEMLRVAQHDRGLRGDCHGLKPSQWRPVLSFWTKWRISRTTRRWMIVQALRSFVTLRMTKHSEEIATACSKPRNDSIQQLLAMTICYSACK